MFQELLIAVSVAYVAALIAYMTFHNKWPRAYGILDELRSLKGDPYVLQLLTKELLKAQDFKESSADSGAETPEKPPQKTQSLCSEQKPAADTAEQSVARVSTAAKRRNKHMRRLARTMAGSAFASDGAPTGIAPFRSWRVPKPLSDGSPTQKTRQDTSEARDFHRKSNTKYSRKRGSDADTKEVATAPPPSVLATPVPGTPMTPTVSKPRDWRRDIASLDDTWTPYAEDIAKAGGSAPFLPSSAPRAEDPSASALTSAE